MMVGDIGSPDETMGISFTHHADQHFSVKGGVLYINGFLWYFEDTDFRVFDSSSDALRWWVAIFSRVGDNWAVRLKWTTDTASPITNYAFPPEDASANVRVNVIGVKGIAESSDIRIQVDYAY